MPRPQPSSLFGVQLKAQRANQVQPHVGRRTRPSNIACGWATQRGITPALRLGTVQHMCMTTTRQADA